MTEKRIRILHVIASLSSAHGGTTSSVLQMIDALRNHDVSCDIVASDDDGVGRRLPQNAYERQMPGRHYLPKSCNFYTYTPKMRSWLLDHVTDYDVVHIHGLFSHVNGLAGRVCRNREVPYIITPHGMINRYGMQHKPLMKWISFRLVEKTLIEGAAALHMTSSCEVSDITNLELKVPVSQIPLAVPLSPLADNNAFHINSATMDQCHIAVFVGRLNRVKNLEAVLGALALEGGQNWHVIVCGDGPENYKQQLQKQAFECGVANRVTWLGYVDGRQKAEALAAADVYLQPSHSESFGLAAVEAVAAGLPCILGEGVAIAADLQSDGYATIVPPTAEGIVNGFREAMVLKSSVSNFACRSRNYVRQNFSPHVIGRELTHLYMSAISRCKNMKINE